MSEKQLVRVEMTVSQDIRDAVEYHLVMNCPQGWEEIEPGLGPVEEFSTDPETAQGTAGTPGQVLYRIHFTDQAPVRSFAARTATVFPDVNLSWSYIREEDWSAAWKQYFTPIEIGRRFVVLPPWLAKEYALQGRQPIFIEPKMAFGTGHHPTTALCLGVIADLADQGHITPGLTFFDLGTGSGILGIGCAKLGLTGVGCDIDEQSVLNAAENKELNDIGEEFRIFHGSVNNDDPDRTYDVVLANILAEPLMELAPFIIAKLAPGGRLVLSGVLAIQAERVAKVYTDLGLPAPRILIEGEWAAIIWV